MSRGAVDGEKWVLIAALALGIGGIALLVWMAMRFSVYPGGGGGWNAPAPSAKLQHFDDPTNGTRCYWLYTGESGGIAMSCVALEKDAGPR